MANITTNYELTQFVASDKPGWLTNYNSDMNKIDTAIKAAAVKAQDGVDAANAAQQTANTANASAAEANAAAQAAGSKAQAAKESVENLTAQVEENTKNIASNVAYIVSETEELLSVKSGASAGTATNTVACSFKVTEWSNGRVDFTMVDAIRQVSFPSGASFFAGIILPARFGFNSSKTQNFDIKGYIGTGGGYQFRPGSFVSTSEGLLLGAFVLCNSTATTGNVKIQATVWK